MICEKCGNILKDTDKFCNRCGNSVENIQALSQDISENKTFYFKRTVLFGNNSFSRKNHISNVTLTQNEIIYKKILQKSISYFDIESVQVKNTVDIGNIIFLVFLWCICLMVDDLPSITILCSLILTIRGLFFLKVHNIIVVDKSNKRYKIVKMSIKENPAELINCILVRAQNLGNNISILGDCIIKNFESKDNMADKIIDTIQDRIDDN